jgi:hypothetical protein
MKINVVNKHHGASGEYIGRGSPLGNPFSSKTGTKAQVVVKDRETAVAAYRDWLNEKIRVMNRPVIEELNRLHALAKQGELNLVCFCAPKACHGDVIKDILLNAKEE